MPKAKPKARAKKVRIIVKKKPATAEKAGKLVLVLGPSGAGKTAVVSGVLSQMAGRCKTVNFGHISQEVVGADRDKFRREASVAQFRRMQAEVARRISKMAEENGGDIMIVTSHAVMWREGGFVPGFPRWVLDNMDVKAIVLISALPEEIAERKAADNAAGKTEGRTRDDTSFQTILQEQDVGRAVAAAYSMYSGAVMKEIVNRQGKLEESVAELRKALENL